LAVTADKAYDSEKVRQQIEDEGALPIIPNRCSAIKKAYCPKRFYRRRHKIENFFCRIKDWRRIAIKPNLASGLFRERAAGRLALALRRLVRRHIGLRLVFIRLRFPIFLIAFLSLRHGDPSD
jgi:transposase